MTMGKRIAAGAIACMCLLVPPAFADTRAEQASEAVDSATAAAYAQALAEFDQAVAQDPKDAALAVSRCEFIEQFTDSEGGRYLERADGDLDACEQHLETLQDSPEVRIHQLENEWGDEAIEDGRALLSQSAAWSLPLRRKLLESLAMHYRYKADGDPEATEIAIQAAELGDVDSIDEAVAALLRTGDAKRAQALLDHAPPAESDWMASKRVRSAVDMPDVQAARREVQRQQAAGRRIKAWAVALAELRAGDTGAAKKALCDTCDTDEDARDARFQVAMAMRDYATAAKTVDLLGGSGFSTNMARFLMLAKASPMSLLRPGMWLSVAIVAACAGFYLLMPGLLLVPVHYRGLARRAAQRMPRPLLDGIRLRHAWLAIAAFLLVPVCVLALVDPAHFGAMVAGNTRPEPKTMLMLVSVSDALCLLLFASIVSRFARAGQFRPAAALAAWKQVLLSLVLCLAVGWMLAAVQRWMAVDSMTDQIRMVNDLINHQETRGGGIAALLVVALLVPVWEEFSFRGLVLGGMARHISFGWANLWQALLFATCHNDWPRFPYYMAMGLMSGWLVKRTGKLAPSILLHVLINALASFVIRH
jgi:membrane protease YdiL (CAAX protease family)